jgi:hypothetical protein
MLKALLAGYSSKDLTDILSGGEYWLEADTPADSAFWEYWIDAVKKVKTEGPPHLKTIGLTQLLSMKINHLGIATKGI